MPPEIAHSTTTQCWQAWFDGATNPNPGKMGIGGLIIAPNGARTEISYGEEFGTNNESEYKAAIAVIKKLIFLGARQAVIRGDSQLVINQINGNWDCRTETLLPLQHCAQKLLTRIPKVSLRWIPREENSEADALSKNGIKQLLKEEGFDSDEWGTQADVGKIIGKSSVYVGKQLLAVGLKDPLTKKPTEKALDDGVAFREETQWGSKYHWSKVKLPAVLFSLLEKSAASPEKPKKTTISA